MSEVSRLSVRALADVEWRPLPVLRLPQGNCRPSGQLVSDHFQMIGEFDEVILSKNDGDAVVSVDVLQVEADVGRVVQHGDAGLDSSFGIDLDMAHDDYSRDGSDSVTIAEGNGEAPFPVSGGLANG